MKPPRIDPEAFNPEKFLAAEQKKQTSAKSELFSRELLFPITFTKRFRKRFIAKLSAFHPAGFKISLTELGTGFGPLRTAIAKELALLGIAEDQALITLLMLDVLAAPQWRIQVKKHNPELMKLIRARRKEKPDI